MSDSLFRSLLLHFLIPTLAVAILALAGGCSSSEEGPTGPNAPTEPLSFETVEQSHVAPEAVGEGESDGVQRVIRDAGAFESFWQDLHGENASVPEINFSEKVIVVAMLGERSSDGYKADIRSITKDTNPTLVTVFVTEVEPGPNCTVSESPTVPYHIVKMDRFSTDQVSFADNGTETEDCG